VLVGNSINASQVLGWQPQYYQLDKIIQHAWNWQQCRHG
jgi:UDP-glucose 4-epimerase